MYYSCFLSLVSVVSSLQPELPRLASLSTFTHLNPQWIHSSSMYLVHWMPFSSFVVNSRLKLSSQKRVKGQSLCRPNMIPNLRKQHTRTPEPQKTLNTISVHRGPLKNPGIYAEVNEDDDKERLRGLFAQRNSHYYTRIPFRIIAMY